MPLVVVDVIRGHDETYLTTLLDALHDAVVQALEVPDTDRYQILHQHEPWEVRALDTGLGYTRSEDLTMIQITSKSRPTPTKQLLYQRIAEQLTTRLGISEQDIIISIVENTAADWSFGRGRAQFLTGDLPDTPTPG